MILLPKCFIYISIIVFIVFAIVGIIAFLLATFVVKATDVDNVRLT